MKPLFKTGDMQNPKNYRPISLLSSLSNFEKIVVKRRENFWEKCDMLISKQYGFRKRKSTLNALVDITETSRAKITKSEETICTFLDLREAFGTVSHGILLKNLKLMVPEEFFSNCWRVPYKIENNLYILMKKFQKFDLNVGVSQGSVLGPLLFLININDITDMQHEN